MSRRQTDAPSNPSPTPSPEPATPDQQGSPAGILFQQPETPAEYQGAWMDPTTGPETGPPAGEPAPPLSSSHGAESAGPAGGGDSPPRSTADRKTLRQRARELAPVLAAAVATVGGFAHQLLTDDGTPEREAGLYLPDDEDQAAISEPLAGLASRRLPEGVDNPDVTDLAQLAMGVVGYVVKQRAKVAELARATFLADDQADDQAAAGARPIGDVPQA